LSITSGRVLVTGASGGIGHAIARAFADRGAEVILSGRRADVLESLAAELGGRAIVCDLADREDVGRLIAAAGEVDVFVAGAGLPATGHITDLTARQIDHILEVNLRAPIVIARELAVGMEQRRRGHLVFVSSISGKVTSPLSSIYNATKFGLRGFALGIRQDLRASGVGASVILPGFVSDAGMFADAGTKLPPGVGTRSPEQVAFAVVDAVEHNRGEVAVAPPLVRIGAALAGLVPGPAATVQRLAGGQKVASELAARQVDKRPPG
jgi:short-subunit dehydrogenase